MSNLFKMGWTAAENGEHRDFALFYGSECAAGWDAYWDKYGMPD